MVSTIFYFHPYLGKIPILTNIFQTGWNHQLDMLGGSWLFHGLWNNPPKLSIKYQICEILSFGQIYGNLLGGSSHLVSVVNNNGYLLYPNWGCGTLSKWPFLACKWGLLTNYLLTGMILQVRFKHWIPSKGESHSSTNILSIFDIIMGI